MLKYIELYQIEIEWLKEVRASMKRGLAIAFRIMVFAAISYCLIMMYEQEFQVPRFKFFNFAIILILIIEISLLKINVKNYKTWLWTLLCALGCALVIYKLGYVPSNYGEDYSLVLRCQTYSFGLFIFAIPYIIKGHLQGLKNKIKSPLFWLSILATVIFMIFDDGVYGFALAFALMLCIELDESKTVEIMKCAAVGYYLAFAGLFTYSLIVAPTKYLDGRYVGIFFYTAKIGEMCAFAFLGCLYFLIEWLNSKKRKIEIVLISVAMVYSLYATYIVAGRSAELGILIAIITVFFLLTKKDKKKFRIRIALAVGVLIVAVAGLSLYAVFMLKRIRTGELTYSDMSYFSTHLVGLLDNVDSRGEFEAGTLANGLDIMLSGRLSIWKRSIAQIQPWGNSPEAFYITHNTFIYWFVRYGFTCAAVLVMWFFDYIVAAGKKVVTERSITLLPLLCSTFLFGLMMGTNEYICGEGLVIMMMLQFPLLAFRKREACEKGLSDL